MTVNGWLQILFFLLAIFLVTPVIGGYFGKVGQASNRVAAWDGEAWLPLGSGIAPTSGAYVGALTAFKGDLITGPAETNYAVPPLAAGAYPFICTVHPNMTGTLTVQ